MNELTVFRFSDEFVEMSAKTRSKVYANEIRDKKFICLGQTNGHYLMCEYGIWDIVGMYNIESFIEVKDFPPAAIYDNKE